MDIAPYPVSHIINTRYRISPRQPVRLEFRPKRNECWLNELGNAMDAYNLISQTFTYRNRSPKANCPWPIGITMALATSGMRANSGKLHAGANTSIWYPVRAV